MAGKPNSSQGSDKLRERMKPHYQMTSMKGINFVPLDQAVKVAQDHANHSVREALERVREWARHDNLPIHRVIEIHKILDEELTKLGKETITPKDFNTEDRLHGI